MTQHCHTDQLVWFKREGVVLKGEEVSLNAEGVGTLREDSGEKWDMSRQEPCYESTELGYPWPDMHILTHAEGPISWEWLRRR